jgi:hypothetical protein
VAEDPAFGKPAFIKAQSLHLGVEIWPFSTPICALRFAIWESREEMV